MPERVAGPFAEAMGEVGGGGDGSFGVNWVDPGLAAERGIGVPLMAAALGPNAGTLLERAHVVRRRFGVDPLGARRLIAIGGSYAFGLRMDGVDGRPLADVLAGAGDRVRRSGGVELANVGGYAQVPQPFLDAGIRGLGARDAFARDLAILAMSSRARAALLGRGEPLSGEATYRAAADCLGDVAAVRSIPDKHLLSSEVGVDLVAIGMASARDEVLCMVGGSSERAEQVAERLEAGFAPGARDPQTDEPMGELVSSLDVTSHSYEGVEVVRAQLATPPGAPRGFLFGRIATGSIPYILAGD